MHHETPVRLADWCWVSWFWQVATCRRRPRPTPPPRSNASRRSAARFSATPTKRRWRGSAGMSGHRRRREAFCRAGRPAGSLAVGRRNHRRRRQATRRLSETHRRWCWRTPKSPTPGWKFSRSCPKLKSLNLRRSTYMTDAGLAHVKDAAEPPIPVAALQQHHRRRPGRAEGPRRSSSCWTFAAACRSATPAWSRSRD